MPFRQERKFCTMFVRTPAEKRASALTKEMDATKTELAETKEALRLLKEEVAKLKSGE